MQLKCHTLQQNTFRKWKYVFGKGHQMTLWSPFSFPLDMTWQMNIEHILELQDRDIQTFPQHHSFIHYSPHFPSLHSITLFFHLPSHCRVPVRGASSSPEPDAVAGVCGSRAVCPALSKQGAFSVCCCKNRGTVYLGTQAFPPSTGQ